MDSIYQKLEKARAQLNQLIEDEAEYSIILKKSQEVDEILNELQKMKEKRAPVKGAFSVLHKSS